jgi:membrane dipeptidase
MWREGAAFPSLPEGRGLVAATLMTELELKARELLRRFPLIDGHNDLPWALRERAGGDASQVRLVPAGAAPGDPGAVSLAVPVDGTHTDLPRLAAGGVGAQFWSVYVPASLADGSAGGDRAGGDRAGGDRAVTAVLEQIDLARRMIASYPGALELALTADDVARIFAAGRVASLLGAEGGHAIAGSLGVLRMLYALGVRYLTLTHNANVGWADSATDEPKAGGLTDFGRDVVREMQRLGMLVDLSHVSVSTMNDALDLAQAPVIFSHSSARALCDSPRNVPDDVLARLAGNGGVCMVTFVPGFVSQECADWTAGLKAEAARRGLDPKDFGQLFGLKPEWERIHPLPRATLAQVADHVEHIRAVAGIAHVGLGGDFDGTPDVTAGLEDVSAYPALFAELLRRGWTEPDCAALAGGNLLRALRAAEAFAAR